MHLARAVEENIHRTTLLCKRLNRHSISDIENGRLDGRVFLGERLQCGFVKVCGPDGCAFFGKTEGRSPSNTLCGGGDHSSLALKSLSHV